MSSAFALRAQIEAALANRIPSALTPTPRMIHPVAATGIQAVDKLLDGGLPLGAITDVVGSECSERTSFAHSFLAGMTQAEKVCAWIDVSDSLDPESVAAASVDLSRLLWVRCGVPPTFGHRRNGLSLFHRNTSFFLQSREGCMEEALVTPAQRS
jgi:recombination protein RecA